MSGYDRTWIHLNEAAKLSKACGPPQSALQAACAARLIALLYSMEFHRLGTHDDCNEALSQIMKRSDACIFQEA